jgi:hypothetical protein
MKELGKMLLAVVVIVVGLLVLVPFIGDKGLEAQANLTPQQLKENADSKLAYDRFLDMKGTLRNNMRDPDSFKVLSRHAPVTNPKIVCVEYQSKNGFGGMNKEFAVLTDKDNILLNDKAVSYWNKFCVGGTVYTLSSI